MGCGEGKFRNLVQLDGVLVPLAHIKGISPVQGDDACEEPGSPAGGYRFRVMLGGEVDTSGPAGEGVSLFFDKPDQAECARRELAVRLEEFYERLIRLRAMVR